MPRPAMVIREHHPSAGDHGARTGRQGLDALAGREECRGEPDSPSAS